MDDHGIVRKHNGSSVCTKLGGATPAIEGASETTKPNTRRAVESRTPKGHMFKFKAKITMRITEKRTNVST